MRRLLALPLAILLVLGLAVAATAQDSGGSTRYYEIPRLNTGLPPAHGYVDRDTPQAMMETFIFAARGKDWLTAAQTLDLTGIEPSVQAKMGPVLAKKLYEVVQRGMWLDWASLPDRPDALLADVSSKDPMAGEPRRSIRLSILQLSDRPVSIRIARVKPEGEDPVWVFSKQIVGNILDLNRIYGPTAFERSLPEFLQKRAFWTLAWWEVIALPLVLLVAIGAAWLVHRWIGILKQRQPYRIARRILDSVQMPVALMVCVGAFWLVKSMLFTFSGAVNTFLSPIQSALFVIALALIAVRIVDAILDRVVRRNIREISDADAAAERDLYTNISAARRAAIVIAFVAGIALVLIQVHAFETLGFSLLASAGVLGLVFAFAARSVLADIMASLQIAIAKTARIGDAVLYKGEWCYVEKINFTYLQLQSWDNRRLIVPVNEFVSNSFQNWTKQDSSLKKIVALRLDHRADVDKLREAFDRFVDEADDVIDKDGAKVQVIDHDASGMLVWFMASASDPPTGWAMSCRLREAMLKRAAELEGSHSVGDAEGTAFLPREREVLLGDFAGGRAADGQGAS